MYKYCVVATIGLVPRALTMCEVYSISLLYIYLYLLFQGATRGGTTLPVLRNAVWGVLTDSVTERGERVLRALTTGQGTDVTVRILAIGEYES